jgi:hypothetical protein
LTARGLHISRVQSMTVAGASMAVVDTLGLAEVCLSQPESGVCNFLDQSWSDWQAMLASLPVFVGSESTKPVKRDWGGSEDGI